MSILFIQDIFFHPWSSQWGRTWMLKVCISLDSQDVLCLQSVLHLPPLPAHLSWLVYEDWLTEWCCPPPGRPVCSPRTAGHCATPRHSAGPGSAPGWWKLRPPSPGCPSWLCRPVREQSITTSIVGRYLISNFGNLPLWPHQPGGPIPISEHFATVDLGKIKSR